MFDRDDDDDDDEFHKSLDLGQSRNTVLPSTSNAAVKTTTAQPSRKRKLTNIEHEQDVGKAFTIKVDSMPV